VGQKISILKKETADSVSKGRNGREIFAQDAVNLKQKKVLLMARSLRK